MSRPGLTLLSTDHCSACEQALDLLLSMPELAGLGLDVVDVIEDAGLLERFGDKVPVLGWHDSHGNLVLTLDWPFEARGVSAWLGQLEQLPGVVSAGLDDAPDG